MIPAQLFTTLMDRHAAGLVLFARQWCGTPEDVVQAAFLKLARAGTPPDSPLPWLYRVVRHGAIDAGRAATEALQSVPLEYREVVVAHLWGGLTFEQVAAAFGGSATTAHRRYVAGIDLLRERLKVPAPTKPPTPS